MRSSRKRADCGSHKSTSLQPWRCSLRPQPNATREPYFNAHTKARLDGSPARLERSSPLRQQFSVVAMLLEFIYAFIYIFVHQFIPFNSLSRSLPLQGLGYRISDARPSLFIRLQWSCGSLSPLFAISASRSTCVPLFLLSRGSSSPLTPPPYTTA